MQKIPPLLPWPLGLLQLMTCTPVLKHFNPDPPTIVKTDASDFDLGPSCHRNTDYRLCTPLENPHWQKSITTQWLKGPCKIYLD